MTRINVIDPSQLTDQHLMAEYRELPMVAGSLRRSLRSSKGLPAIPGTYTLNKGHVTFFFNKGGWLKKRYYALVLELLERGYQLDARRRADFDTFENNGLAGDWQADQAALEINRERIRERILAKPDWYRYKGQKINEVLIFPTKLWSGTLA